MADDDKQFFSEEQKAQEEIEKIKLGEAEYDPKDLETLVEKGKKVDEYQKKYNTDFDKAWGAYGKTTQELKQAKEEIERLNQQVQLRQTPSDLTEEQIAQAREQARKIGIMTQGDMDAWYQSRRAAEKLLEECGTFESDIDGKDGRPKFNTDEILNYMVETGIKNPMKAYKDKYEAELDAWKSSELNKTKTEALPTMSTPSTKTPRVVAANKDNINALIRQELWGNEKPTE